MTPRIKVAAVLGGYVVAFLIASAVVAVYVAATSGADRQAYGAMYAFGDSLLFLAVFGVAAVPATAAALFFFGRVAHSGLHFPSRLSPSRSPGWRPAWYSLPHALHSGQVLSPLHGQAWLCSGFLLLRCSLWLSSYQVFLRRTVPLESHSLWRQLSRRRPSPDGFARFTLTDVQLHHTQRQRPASGVELTTDARNGRGVSRRESGPVCESRHFTW